MVRGVHRRRLASVRRVIEAHGAERIDFLLGEQMETRQQRIEQGLRHAFRGDEVHGEFTGRVIIQQRVQAAAAVPLQRDQQRGRLAEHGVERVFRECAEDLRQRLIHQVEQSVRITEWRWGRLGAQE